MIEIFFFSVQRNVVRYFFGEASTLVDFYYFFIDVIKYFEKENNLYITQTCVGVYLGGIKPILHATGDRRFVKMLAE